jgi:hypothetical protein
VITTTTTRFTHHGPLSGVGTSAAYTKEMTMLSPPIRASCHQMRRVASETAARTPGPEAVELITPNSVITVATAIG